VKPVHSTRHGHSDPPLAAPIVPWVAATAPTVPIASSSPSPSPSGSPSPTDTPTTPRSRRARVNPPVKSGKTPRKVH